MGVFIFSTNVKFICFPQKMELLKKMKIFMINLCL